MKINKKTLTYALLFTIVGQSALLGTVTFTAHAAEDAVIISAPIDNTSIDSTVTSEGIILNSETPANKTAVSWGSEEALTTTDNTENAVVDKSVKTPIIWLLEK